MDDRPVPTSRKPWLPLWVTLALSLGLGALIVWQWQVFEQREREQSQQRFEQEAQDIGQRVKNRMHVYEMALRGVSGLMTGSDHVSLTEWDRALDQLQLQDRYPGTLALVWSRYLRAEQLDAFLAAQQSQGRADYQLSPVGAREHYLLIDYISPLDWRNRRVLGYDMLSEAVRSAAVEQAIDSGQAILSAPVTLRQEIEANVQGGGLLFLPVYLPGMPLSSVEERRAALLGVVHGAFRSHELMEGILGAQSQRFDVVIKDQQALQTPLLSAEEQGASPQPRFQHELELPLYGRNWVLQVTSTPAYEAAFSSRSGVSLWIGLVAAALLALLVGGYLYWREREMHANHLATNKLREREERFRLLVERLPVATLLCNAQGRIEMANRSAADLLDSTPESLVGERVKRFLPSVEQLSALAIDHDTSERSNEYLARRDLGEEIPVALSLSVLGDSGGVNYLINLIDLRARK
ncbi:MAG: CHASE domain-containing protein, partial [Pseudomonas sp.]|uniref:CHASE domain-containing protein n=1 Tax=Pseudomonas sp. TaxID=306 RepID=UPI003981B499